jgi:hypothetical protein
MPCDADGEHQRRGNADGDRPRARMDAACRRARITRRGQDPRIERRRGLALPELREAAGERLLLGRERFARGRIVRHSASLARSLSIA